jgi:hypothetical protein
MRVVVQMTCLAVHPSNTCAVRLVLLHLRSLSTARWRRVVQWRGMLLEAWWFMSVGAVSSWKT